MAEVVEEVVVLVEEREEEPVVLEEEQEEEPVVLPVVVCSRAGAHLEEV